MEKAFRGAVPGVTFLTLFYHSSNYSQVFTIHCIFFRTLVLSLFVAITEEISWPCVTLASAENRGKRVHTLFNINSTA